MAYTSEAQLGQASERTLEEVKAEAGDRPAASNVRQLGSPWLGIVGLALFIWIVYRGGPPRGRTVSW